MATLPPELANLPPPSVIETPDYAARLLQLQNALVAIFQQAGIPYTTINLETDPANILLQVTADWDIKLRTRINEAIRSWFLAYAERGDLDVLAQWYDVTRLPLETDDALRRRVVESIKGRSPGGTEARYRSIALGADVRVADASIYTVGRDPTINVAVFSTDAGGVADAALIAKVNAALQNPAVRMVNDRIVVAPAARQTQAIVAQYWLLPTAAETVVAAAMQANLAAAWDKEMLLGRDLTRSWLISKLMVDGVQRVNLITPAADVIMPFNQAAARGAVTLTSMGRDY